MVFRGDSAPQVNEQQQLQATTKPYLASIVHGHATRQSFVLMTSLDAMPRHAADHDHDEVDQLHTASMEVTAMGPEHAA